MIVEKPIFIIGTGRCGSTIFHEILSYHPNVAFLSGLCNRYPEKLWLNHLLMKLIDIPILQHIIRAQIKPSEGYSFWRYYDKSFNNPCRDLVKADVTNKVKFIIPKLMARMLTKQRNRLLIKITGWPRIEYLKEIFPCAKFIHVIRDGRAVANSLLNVEFWDGWLGHQNWRYGELTSKHKEEWEKYNKSFVILAGIEWKIIMDAWEKAKDDKTSENFLEIKYEHLCSEPIETFRLIAKFSELEWSSKFEAVINQFKLENMNNKWREELNDYQKEILCDCLHDYLEKYDYKV